MSTPSSERAKLAGEVTEGDRAYVVLKRGLFWRPEDKGYTSDISQAGRYTKEEAESRCHGGEQPVTMALASLYETSVQDADMVLACALSHYPEKRPEFAHRIAAHRAAAVAERDAKLERQRVQMEQFFLTDIGHANKMIDEYRKVLSESESKVAALEALVVRLREAVEYAITSFENSDANDREDARAEGRPAHTHGYQITTLKAALQPAPKV